MNHLELTMHKEHDAIMERLESHRLARSRVGPAETSKFGKLAANLLAALGVAAFATMPVAIALESVQVAQYLGMVYWVSLLLWVGAVLIAPFWQMFKELRSGNTPLTFSHQRAATNFRLIRGLALRFSRRSLEATRTALEVERQLLERRKPLIRKLVALWVFLVLAGRAKASGLKVPRTFDPIAWIEVLDPLLDTASGWPALVAITGALWVIAYFQGVIDILQAHSSLLSTAAQQETDLSRSAQNEQEGNDAQVEETAPRATC